MKFLIDECLSPELVKLAHDRGHGHTLHSRWRLQPQHLKLKDDEIQFLTGRGISLVTPFPPLRGECRRFDPA